MAGHPAPSSPTLAEAPAARKAETLAAGCALDLPEEGNGSRLRRSWRRRRQPGGCVEEAAAAARRRVGNPSEKRRSFCILLCLEVLPEVCIFKQLAWGRWVHHHPPTLFLPRGLHSHIQHHGQLQADSPSLSWVEQA
ncbi:uncharacterized protein LOC128595711 isoform X6 [Nycticebus coucang]|uniref:uncharacterized protein LOC128595711 isoform X6 n=1 Tax=Nycticebus coucang TaxID=9470 RepID=UPI00234DA28B|nr:uncharacterized protein LOC128595711 isoform X6 [Nycticebus coucang]